MLEKYGFIERVESSERREHPCRLVDQQISWDGAEEGDSAVTNELNEMLIEVEARRQQTYLRTRGKLPTAWRKAASAQGAFRWMTSSELRSMTAEIGAILDQYRDRNVPARRPPGARLVRLTSVAVRVRQSRT